MRPQRYADHFPGFGHHHPCRLIGNRKNPILAGLAALGGIFPQSVSNFLGNEHDLMFPPALGLSQIQLPVLEIIGGELQHLTDAHAPSGHQFQDQTVSDLGRPENDLVNGILFDDVPAGGDLRTKQFPQHRGIARVLEIWTQIVVDEIEKRCQVGEADFPGLGFAAVGDAFQKLLDKINREFLQLQVAVVPAEGRDYRLVGSQGVFFECDR